MPLQKNTKNIIGTPKSNYRLYTRETSDIQNTRTHSHDSYEIYMLLENRIEFFADGAIYSLAPKDLIAIHGTSPHGRLTICDGSAKFMVILLEKNFFYREQLYPVRGNLLPPRARQPQNQRRRL